jgi:hypothetical protein
MALEGDLHLCGRNSVAGESGRGGEISSATNAAQTVNAGLVAQGCRLLALGPSRVRSDAGEQLLKAPPVDGRHEDPLAAPAAGAVRAAAATQQRREGRR